MESMIVGTDATNTGNPGNSYPSEWSAFMAHGQNVQLDPNQVRVGDLLLIATKDSVRIGSKPSRLIAEYDTIQVNHHESCGKEGEEHAMTVCNQCIRGSWLWDYLFRNVRTLRNFAHGTPRAYDYFGCRCDPCTQAHNAYLGPTSDVPYAEPVPRLGHRKI